MDRLLSDFRIWLGARLPAGVMHAIRPFLTVQFVMFMIMGIINTAISVAVATLLDIWHVHFLSPSNIYRILAHRTNLNFICGYAVSIITSFFLNCRFTFHQNPTWDKFIKFPVSYIPNFLFQYLFVFIFTILNWNKTAAYICAAIIGTPVTFAFLKLVVFRRKKKTQEG